MKRRKKVSNSVSSEHSENHVHVHRDDVGARLGMWLFLFNELLLFGGLFVVYLTYRIEYNDAFLAGAKALSIGAGTFNTIVLLTSSLTMVLAIVALRKKKKWLSLTFLGSTIVLALVFMVVKYYEWMSKIHHGIYPGSEQLAEKANGEIIFYGLYYTMTGLHGLHVIIGIVIILFIMVFIIRDKVTPDSFVKLENAGLYWHLVDLIWIFLFPLFYLLH
jgi:cytochrome c oxidase subunit III